MTTLKSEDLDDRIEGLKQRVANFPQTPGVYLMKNKQDKIIYVGKAKKLKNRVRTYFAAKVDSGKTQLLVKNIFSVDYMLTETEAEAFLLEASLIKKYRPRYNVRLKDDKAYPYIRLSYGDEFPRFYLSRKAKKDQSLYFGPYTSGYVVHETIRFLNRTFKIRDCRDHVMKSRKRPCLTHQIGSCTAPCVGLVTAEDYRSDIIKAKDFLHSDSQSTLEDIKNQMLKLADQEKFELAARLRDSWQAMSRVLEKQSVVNAETSVNQDVVGFYGDERGTLLEVIHVRSGRVIGQRSQFFPLLNTEDPLEDPREWLSSFINQYYQENLVPDQLLLPVDLGIEIEKLLEQVFQHRGYEQTRVFFPTQEKTQQLLDMAFKNAKSHFSDYVSKSEKKRQGLKLIQSKFALKDMPYRIECFDISHFQGAESVGSQVVFEDGAPSKNHYRRYKLKSTKPGDDYGAMREVLSRRFHHEEWEEPDLILIDGGKGQLQAVRGVLEELSKDYVPLVSLAKERTFRNFQGQRVEKSQERFYLPGRGNPIVFAEASPAFRILVGLRDEAHRFAIDYHRKLREGSTLHSQLDDIPGVGEILKKRILTSYSSVEEIKVKGLSELVKIQGVHRDLAEIIMESLFGES